MATVRAARNHLGNERFLQDIDLSIGTGGFGGTKIFEFESVKMHDCYAVQIKNLPGHNQQFLYLKSVIEDLIAEVDEVTPETEVMFISDQPGYSWFIMKLKAYHEESKKLKEVNKRIREIKFDVGKDHTPEIEEEYKQLLMDEIKLKESVSTLRSNVDSGFWDKYFGVRMNVRGKDVNVVVRQKRHRFSIRKKNEYVFHRNIWSAVKAAK